jgi:hypothetical protein
MRFAFAPLLALACVAVALAGADKSAAGARFGIEPDLKTYPQGTPKEALASVLKAIDEKRIDYLLAQLTDPDWVDGRLKKTDGDFKALVKETTAKLLDDPGPAKKLQRFLKEGDWDEGPSRATVRLKDEKERGVFLRKVEDRWFLENDLKLPTPN